MHDPVLHGFISYLAEKKAEQEDNPDKHVKIELSTELIASVRESFRQNILDGERHLHILSHMLSGLLLEGDFELHSNVIGVLPGDEERPFLIRERITQNTLFSSLDIDLGNQMLDNFRYRIDRDWVPLQLSANFVEYIPPTRPATGVNRLTSRVKAEEELWNKVADEIFSVDQLVSRDKHLRQYSKYVKDIFGIKIICEDEPTCMQVHHDLQDITNDIFNWEKLGELHHFEVNPADIPPTDKMLEFVETKDYLTCERASMKRTGWRALKSVVMWHERLFEIQVQPLSNYYLELDHMSGPSHRSFKLSRDTMRDEVALHVPLYGFYRDLLKMLFMESAVSFECQNASVIIS
jgi:ppGpp synthetase/RelA/SpoT-type nucleotidyltranferase